MGSLFSKASKLTDVVRKCLVWKPKNKIKKTSINLRSGKFTKSSRLKNNDFNCLCI